MSHNTKTCIVDGCDRKIIARGMCEKDYRAWLKSSASEGFVQVRHSSPERALQSRVRADGDCVVWTGYTTTDGYGRLRVEGKMMLVHRFSYELTYGPIPDGKHIDHTCYTPACVKVEHLRLVTIQQNNYNRAGPTHINSSGARNVHRNGKGWIVRVKKDGNQHLFGTYSTVEEAKRVAEQARLELFGEYSGRG